MLSCGIWFSAPSFWMGGGPESHCLGRVYSLDGAVRRHHPNCIWRDTGLAASLWQRATSVTVARYAGSTWKNNNTLHTEPLKLLC